MSETPVTFKEPAYLLFDIEQNAVRMTQWGTLAIFNTKIMADITAAKLGPKVEVRPVWIVPVEKGQ